LFVLGSASGRLSRNRTKTPFFKSLCTVPYIELPVRHIAERANKVQNTHAKLAFLWIQLNANIPNDSTSAQVIVVTLDYCTWRVHFLFSYAQHLCLFCYVCRSCLKFSQNA
jgi:hypothetical protein